MLVREHAPAVQSRGLRGFSLVEMLVALSIGALIVVSLTHAMQVFSANVEAVRAEPDTDLEEAVTLVTDEVRRAWYVEQPSANQIDIFDPYGNRTSYFKDGSQLKVRRPSGQVGVMLEDVQDVDFSVDTITRLRDDTPVDSYGTVWATTVPPGDPEPLVVPPGDCIAIGFMAPLDAPAEMDVVANVEEELLEATLGQLQLKVAQLIDGTPTVGGDLAVMLFEARAPGEGQPFGDPLATMSIPLDTLPPAVWSAIDLEPTLPPSGKKGKKKVAVCHIPPGNPGNAHTIYISSNAVNPHLAHGDILGDCAEVLPEMHLEAPTLAVPIDLGSLGVKIQPGRAYSVVLAVQGDRSIVVNTIPNAAAERSGVAYQLSHAGVFESKAISLPCTIQGTRSYTQTRSVPVITRVTLDADLVDGRTIAGSAIVTGQTAVRNPWLGAVPGEMPTLELHGN